MERSPLTLRVGTTLTTERGVSISVSKISRKSPIPINSVDKHEASHVIAAQAAGGIILATVVGTSEYAGATWPVVMTAMAAMAGKAGEGTGYHWDEFLTEHFLKANPGSAESDAAVYLTSRHDYVYAVARKLHDKGTITQGDVDDAYKEVDDERAGNWEVAIHMQAKDGSTNIYMRRSRHGEVILPGELLQKDAKKEEKKKDDKPMSEQRPLEETLLRP